MCAMFVARLVCSDSDCAEELEVRAPTLEELDRLLCDCGCTLEIIAWPDEAFEDAQVIRLAAGRRSEGSARREAA